MWHDPSRKEDNDGKADAAALVVVANGALKDRGTGSPVAVVGEPLDYGPKKRLKHDVRVYVGAAKKKRCQGLQCQGEEEKKENGCGEKGQVLQEVASGQSA